MTSFTRGVRAIAGASLLGAVGFPAFILLIAVPIALLVAALQDGLAWLTRVAGLTGPFVEGAVGLASVVGGVLLFAWTAGSVLRLWRTYAGARRGPGSHASSERRAPADTGLDWHPSNAAGAAWAAYPGMPLPCRTAGGGRGARRKAGRTRSALGPRPSDER